MPLFLLFTFIADWDTFQQVLVRLGATKRTLCSEGQTTKAVRLYINKSCGFLRETHVLTWGLFTQCHWVIKRIQALGIREYLRISQRRRINISVMWRQWQWGGWDLAFCCTETSYYGCIWLKPCKQWQSLNGCNISISCCFPQTSQLCTVAGRQKYDI